MNGLPCGNRYRVLKGRNSWGTGRAIALVVAGREVSSELEAVLARIRSAVAAVG
jgi:hypothetical protein